MLRIVTPKTTHSILKFFLSTESDEDDFSEVELERDKREERQFRTKLFGDVEVVVKGKEVLKKRLSHGVAEN